MANLTYIGTRDQSIKATASQAILRGICPDGGLYIPETIPHMEKSLEELSKLSYRELAFEVLSLFLDFTDEELRACIDGAYDEKFDTAEIAPLVQKGDAFFLELYHGRTLAFKDMALSILPYFMKTAAKREGIDKEIVILTATSGDTGKAALEGFAGVEGTKIIVFFPEDGVSPVQKLQMTTQEGDNTCVVGILGNFDDAQSAVKSIFTDKELGEELARQGYLFSSANSINIGRLIPQIVYYFRAYLDAVKQGALNMGEEINFAVPTGNFGDILAGWYAMKMGLPVGHFVCASNDNKVLYDFFCSGTYDRNRQFHVTVSPSMDILISSNLERLLCHMTGQQATKEDMAKLSEEGKYSVEITEKKISGEFATEPETYAAIKKFFGETGYVMDTHTAVAYAAYQKYKGESKDTRPMVIVSTASPYKFTKDVMMALDEKYASEDAFALMHVLEKLSGVSIPEPIRGIENRTILHNNVCERDKIKDFVKRYLL
ncbi:MAG: threonine synthase [Clostridia bacterium]|nr:threonine synthase [Clostridia bacterium]